MLCDSVFKQRNIKKVNLTQNWTEVYVCFTACFWPWKSFQSI